METASPRDPIEASDFRDRARDHADELHSVPVELHAARSLRCDRGVRRSSSDADRAVALLQQRNGRVYSADLAVGLRILAANRDHVESAGNAARAAEETRRIDRVDFAGRSDLESVHHHPSALPNHQQNALLALCIPLCSFVFHSSISSREFPCRWRRITRQTTSPSFPSLRSGFLRLLRRFPRPLRSIRRLLLLSPLPPLIPSPFLLLLRLLPRLPPLLRFSLRDRPAPSPNPSKNTRLASNPFSPPSRAK